MMMRLNVRCSTMLLTSSMLLVLLSPLCASRQFYISPSSDLCPGGQAATANGSCFTIEQFAAASTDLTQGLGSILNVTLELIPGNHTLKSELFIAEHVTSLLMRSTDASILCSGANASITIERVRNVHISGVSFASCAPLRVSSVETFSLSDSNFQINGSIVLSNVLDATIMRSYFKNNIVAERAFWSGGIPADSIVDCCSSGAIHSLNSSLQIHQSIFSNNFGYTTGGVYSVNSNVVIRDSIFNQNRGFRNVYVNRVPSDGSAGALYVNNGTLQIMNSNFSDNLGHRPSGAVNLEGLESVEITSSNFERNRAYFGCGALVIKEALKSVVRLSKFENNSDGAACIFVKRISQASVAVIESAFIGNSGSTALALGSYDHNSNLSISSSVFTRNKANGFGGAVSLDRGLLSISRSTFTSNSASGIGGALYVTRSDVVVTDSSFIGNTAVSVYETGSSYQEGGAVVVQNYGTFTAYRTEFVNNVGSDGGGIHVFSGSISVHQCKFLRNRAKNVGGAIASCRCRLPANITITDSTFRRNTAESQCGAVHFLGIQSVNLISGSTFTNNGKFSTRDGGVACAKRVTLSVVNSSFSRNLALLSGGVMFISSHSRVSVSQSTFNRNVVGVTTPTQRTSGSGGVFNIERGSAIHVRGSTFTSNYAKQGGVFSVDSASLEVNETNFFENNASVGILIAACSRSNVSLDVDVSLSFTSIDYRNCTLYDPQRDISTIQATSTIIAPVMTILPSTQIPVRLSSTTDLERHAVTTAYPSAKGTFAAPYSSKKATTNLKVMSTAAMTYSHASVKPSSDVMKVSVMFMTVSMTSSPSKRATTKVTPAATMTLSHNPVINKVSPMSSVVQSTVTLFSAAHNAPSSSAIIPSSYSRPVVSNVADSTTEEGSTISHSQIAGSNVGIRVAIPVAVVIFFVAGLILVIFLVIIVYARKSRNCM